MAEVTAPRLHANTIAVKKSKMDLDRRMDVLPVIPASRLP